jgi:LSD1 subclass zinc finger protein
MVSQELLDMLVCPACHKPLQLKDNGQSLKCAECRRVFPIKDDIPVMLLDEASIDPS